MERVAGIQTGGQRAGVRPLHEGPLPGRAAPRPRRHVRHRHADLATRWSRCTRCSGSSTRRGFESRGIEHFDAWAATFGEVVDTMEISPDGATLAAPQPVREVREPARAAADVPGVRRRADGRDARPAAARGSQAASRPSSPARCRRSSARSRSELVARYERIRSQKVDPREDNALAITTDGRKLALDARLLSADAPDFPELEDRTPWSSNVADIWRRTDGDPRHAARLLRHGREPDAVGLLGLRRGHREARRRAASRASRSPPSATPTRDAKKQALFERVRQGTVRVLIGSHAEDGHRDQRPEAARRPAPPRRPVEAGRGRAAGGPNPPAGERERGGRRSSAT